MALQSTKLLYEIFSNFIEIGFVKDALMGRLFEVSYLLKY